MSKRLRGSQSVISIFLIVCASTLTVQASAFYSISKIGCCKAVNRTPMHSRQFSRNEFPSRPSKTTSLQASPSALVGASAALVLRGGEVSELATAAYDWCINLGNPSALVAGAVVATLYENIGSGALDIQERDSKVVRFGKRLTRVLLLTAFAFEIVSIFVTTVTGTMLLSKPEHVLDDMVEVTKDTTPLSFLHDNFEFEYLTARITFLQGLLNWLMAIALNHIIPHGEPKGTRVMNKYIGSSLILTIILMVAFYNNHMNFYPNYFVMIMRWLQVIWQKFVWHWPPLPSILVSVPCLINTILLGYSAFFRPDKPLELWGRTKGSSNSSSKRETDSDAEPSSAS